MSDGPRLPSRLADLAADVLAGGKITADDVLMLRQDVFKDGVVDRDEASFVFHLDVQDAEKDAAWKPFFVDTLTDYFVWKQYPRGVLSDEDGAFLVERVTHDGRIDHESEFALILSIISKARECPEDVVVLALEAVEESVLEGSGKLFGKGRRRPGVIDEVEVETIRNIVFGSGGGGSLTITRREAELLFRLNNATVGKKNAPGWRELFITAVGSYIMHPAAAPEKIDVDEVRRRDESLARMAEGEGIGAMFDQIASKEGLTYRRDQRRNEEEELQRDLAEVEAEVEREAVQRDEVEWLIARITEDDAIHANERALLAYIKEKAVHIDPSLDPYFEKYGV